MDYLVIRTTSYSEEKTKAWVFTTEKEASDCIFTEYRRQLHLLSEKEIVVINAAINKKDTGCFDHANIIYSSDGDKEVGINERSFSLLLLEKKGNSNIYNAM